MSDSHSDLGLPLTPPQSSSSSWSTVADPSSSVANSSAGPADDPTAVSAPQFPFACALPPTPHFSSDEEEEDQHQQQGIANGGGQPSTEEAEAAVEAPSTPTVTSSHATETASRTSSTELDSDNSINNSNGNEEEEVHDSQHHHNHHNSSGGSSAHDDQEEEEEEEESAEADVVLATSEQKALSTIESYQAAVRSKLASDALCDSSGHVTAAVREMIDSHSSDTRQLQSENEALRGQLLAVTGLDGQLSDRLATTQPLEASCAAARKCSHNHNEEQRTQTQSRDFVPATQVTTDSDGNGGGGKDQDEEGGSSSGGGGMRAVGPDNNSNDISTHQQSSSSSCCFTLPSGDAHDSLLASAAGPASPSAVAALLADYKLTQGIARTLAAEQQRWKAHFAELSQLLATVTRENASHRREVARLATSTVDVARYQEATQARDRAVRDLELLRMETTKLAEQLDREVLLRTIVGGDNNSDNNTINATTMEAASVALAVEEEGGHYGDYDDDDDDAASAPHPGLWAEALREVQEQAALTADHAATRALLAAAEASLHALSGEKAALTAAMAALQAEDELLRRDAQGLVFRNGVLSQQVASLLVKVENLRRCVKNHSGSSDSTTDRHGDGDGSACRPSVRSRSESDDVGGGGAHRALAPPPPPQQQQPFRSFAGLGSGAQQQQQWQRSRASSTAASIRVASAATELLLRRGGSGNTNSNYSSAGSSTRRGAAADTTLPPQQQQRNTSSETLLSSNALDVPFLPPQQPSAAPLSLGLDPSANSGGEGLPEVEVERGVRRGLATYASTRRSVTLRRFGCGTMEVALAVEPRLPACDQLSGVALGRPSPYSLLDPASGTVHRRSSTAELTLVRSSTARSNNTNTNSSTTGEDNDAINGHDDAAATVISQAGEAENRSFLDMLDMIDADESLDRHSINTVSELVVRNRELVGQLYDTTQRAERAEAAVARNSSGIHRHHHHHRGAGAAKSIVSPQEEGENNSNNDDGLVNTACSSVESGGGVGGEEVGRPSASSRKRARGEEAATTASVEVEEGTDQLPGVLRSDSDMIIIASQHGYTGGDGTTPTTRGEADAAVALLRNSAPWADVVLGPQALSEATQRTVAGLISAVHRQHDATVARLDEGLAASLLQLLEAKSFSTSSTTTSDGGPALQRRASLLSDASNTLLDSLVNLCTSQSVTLAQLAVEATAGQRAAQADVHRNGWAQAQALLQRTREGIAEALTRTGDNIAHSIHDTSNSINSSGGGEDSTLVASTSLDRTKNGNNNQSAIGGPVQSELSAAYAPEEGVLGQVVNLTHLMSLLQTATDKEGTVLRVHTMAQERQRAFMQMKEGRLAKLAARTERAAAALSAMIAQQQQQQQQRTATTTAAAAVGGGGGGASPALTALRPSASPLVQSLDALGATTVDSQRRLSPAPHPPTTATTTTTILDSLLLLPGVRGESSRGSGGLVISEHPYLVIPDDDSAADEADDDAAFGELRSQLSLVQAQSARLASELNAEKAAHLSLYERMWKLELDRGTAREKRDVMAAAMREMHTRVEYEAVIASLDAVKAGVSDRDAQLDYAQAENGRLLTQLDLLNEQLSSHQQRHAIADAGKNAELDRLTAALEEENRRYNQLYGQSKTFEEANTFLRRDAVASAARERDGEEQLRALRAQLADAQDSLLTSDAAQAVLLSMYPGDTLLAAHAAAVRNLRAAKAGLEAQQQQSAIAAQEAAEALRDSGMELRRAVQERQSAEVRLQEALLFRSTTTTAAAAGPNNVNSNVMEDGDDDVTTTTAMNGVDASVHLHPHPHNARQAQLLLDELRATVESQSQALALLRSNESAWRRREADLRAQLALLGRDPISETARRYGLAACDTFEAQIRELSGRAEALQAAVDDLTRERAALMQGRRGLEDKLRATEEAAAGLRGSRDATSQQLTAAAAALADARAAVAALAAEKAAALAELQRGQAALASASAASAAALHQSQDVARSLQECRADRDKFYSDNVALVGKVTELERDLMRSDAERRAVGAALAVREAAPMAGGGGGARSSSRRQLRRPSTYATPHAAAASFTTPGGGTPNNTTGAFGSSS